MTASAGMQGAERSLLDLVHAWSGALPGCEERELIYAAVSQANLAHRCVAKHGPRAMAELAANQVPASFVELDPRSLSPATRALLQFAEQLTLSPDAISAQDVERAIAAGASVDRLRDVVELTAHTNVANRIRMVLVSPMDT